MSNGTDITGKVTPARAKKMFPATPLAPITKHLPFVLQALKDSDLGDKPMVLMALATIRAETEGFVPISEFKSKFNTKSTPFDRYEPGTPAGKRLGNTKPGDGPRFKGRGFVQLTGRFNYTRVGKQLQAPLVSQPDEANDPALAGRILARFLKNNEDAVRAALNRGNLKKARKLVNGGSHGLDRFTDAFERGEQAIPDA
jgi:putative chitinase